MSRQENAFKITFCHKQPCLMRPKPFNSLGYVAVILKV